MYKTNLIKGRVTKVCLFASFLLAPGILFAQSEKVTLKGNMSLREALSSIEQQTPYQFDYSLATVDNSTQKELSFENMELSQVLPALLPDAEYNYSINGEKIVIDNSKQKSGSIGKLEGKPYKVGANPLPIQPVGGRFAIKTNLLHAATLTPNLAVEFAVGQKKTLEIYGAYNNWAIHKNDDNMKQWKHWVIQPELRFWNCERFNGGFWGVHAFYGKYDMGGFKAPFNIVPHLQSHRYKGWFVGAGASYGYQVILGDHWNLEATIGVGYAYRKYRKYECQNCDNLIAKDKKHYFGPTKLGLSIVYLFKSTK